MRIFSDLPGAKAENVLREQTGTNRILKSQTSKVFLIPWLAHLTFGDHRSLDERQLLFLVSISINDKFDVERNARTSKKKSSFRNGLSGRQL